MWRGRRLCVNREQPLRLRHAWWNCDAIVDGRIQDSAGGVPLIVVNPSTTFSAVASGIASSNRISKSAATVGDIVYSDAKLTDLTLDESFCFWAFQWPDSPDLNSDSFTKPLFNQSPWQATEAGLNVSVYNGNVTVSLTDGRGNSSSLSAYTAFGTIGALMLMIVQYDASTRKVQASRNGAAFTTAAAALPDAQSIRTKTRLNCGHYVLDNVVNPVTGDGSNRVLHGKWDELGYVKGKLLTDADASWLWNAGAGRVYADAVSYGLFNF
jgi:hypothetical protein